MAKKIKGLRSRTRVPAGFGRTFMAAKGQYIAVIDVQGGQTCDFWSIDAQDFEHHLSPPYTMMHIWSLRPTIGHELVSNRRVPMLVIVHDDVGSHDMLCPACDNERYFRDFGVSNHRNCSDNFKEVMKEHGWGSRPVPNPPFNFFMNTTVDTLGKVVFERPLSMPGDRVIMQAYMDVLGVASACPMDLTPSGAGGISDIEILVGGDLESLKVANAR